MSYLGTKNRIISKLQTELSPKLTYHNLYHAQRVLKNLESHIAAIELDARQAELLRIAGIGHDIGFTEVYEGHETKSIEILEPICLEEGYSNVEFQYIAEMVLSTRIDIEPQTLMEKMLVDADLEYLGSGDCDDILRLLYQEWINYDLIQEDYKLFVENSVKFMEMHNYETTYAIMKSRKTENLKNLRIHYNLD